MVEEALLKDMEGVLGADLTCGEVSGTDNNDIPESFDELWRLFELFEVVEEGEVGDGFSIGTDDRAHGSGECEFFSEGVSAELQEGEGKVERRGK